MPLIEILIGVTNDHIYNIWYCILFYYLQLELTCCFEREQNFTNANNRKLERYSALPTDIENRGYTENLLPFEIGSRGLIKIQTKSDLLLCLKTQHSFKIGNNFFKEISKIALLCSFAIYHSGQDPVWVSLPLLTPQGKNKYTLHHAHNHQR